MADDLTKARHEVSACAITSAGLDNNIRLNFIDDLLVQPNIQRTLQYVGPKPLRIRPSLPAVIVIQLVKLVCGPFADKQFQTIP
jgi:hypothetical protein